MESFFQQTELSELGLNSIGENVRISKKASIYGAENISLGNNVRIDDFCILSGKIFIENNIHIAAGCYLYGGEAGIKIYDFANLSSRIAVYAISDDYSGSSMTNPTIPDKYKNITHKKVIINRHVIIGPGSTLLPGVIIGEGTAIGAMSLVNDSLPPWKICVGIPAKPIKDRSKALLRQEFEFLNSTH